MKKISFYFAKGYGITLTVDEYQLTNKDVQFIEGTKNDKKYYVNKDNISYYSPVGKDDEQISTQFD